MKKKFSTRTAGSTGWSKKVSHYQELLLNRIKNHQLGYSFNKF